MGALCGQRVHFMAGGCMEAAVCGMGCTVWLMAALCEWWLHCVDGSCTVWLVAALCGCEMVLTDDEVFIQ